MSHHRILVALAATTLVAGCATLLGFDDVVPGEGEGEGGDGAGGLSSGGMGGTGSGGSGGGGILGTSCGAPEECAPFNCIDGVCCDAPSCDGVCRSCAVVGLEGTCSPHHDSTDPEEDCGATSVCDAQACTTSSVDVWSTQAAADYHAHISHVVVTDDGHVWALGLFSGTVTFPGCEALASSDVFDDDLMLVQLDPSGGCRQAISFGGTGTPEPVGLDLDPSGNIYLAANNTGPLDVAGMPFDSGADSRIFVIKLDPNGNVLDLLTSVGVGPHEAHQLHVNPFTSEIALAGTFDDELTFGSTVTSPAANRLFVAKLDDALTERWIEIYAGNGSPRVTALSGNQLGDVRFAVFPGFDATLSVGCASMTTGFIVDPMIVSLASADGACKTTIKNEPALSSPESLSVRSIVPGDDASEFFMAGSFNGPVPLVGSSTSDGVDGFVVEMQDVAVTNYSILTAAYVGGVGEKSIRSMVRGVDGIWAVGWHDGVVTIDGADLAGQAADDHRMLAIGFDTNLIAGHALSFGDADEQEADAVALNPWGAAIVAGRFDGALMGLQPTQALSSAAALEDAFVLAISPAP